MMSYVYAVLGFTALALAFPVPKQPSHAVVTSVDQKLTVVTVHDIVSGRGLITAPRLAVTLQASPRAIPISSTNTTAHGPVASASPTQAPFSLPQQSQWGPSEIGTVFFGGFASILGILTIGIPYYLYRRRLRSQQSGSWPTISFSS